MKIIIVSNFDNEAVSDVVIAENVPVYYCKCIAAELNRVFGGDKCPDFFRIVRDDYKLHIFEP